MIPDSARMCWALAGAHLERGVLTASEDRWDVAVHQAEVIGRFDDGDL